MTREACDRIRFILLAAAVTLVGLAGYFGYVLYPRFGLPSVAGASLLLLAAAAGFAAFFSPCSFPLLATLLARQTDPDAAPTQRVRRAALYGTALSVGAIAFVLAVGTLFALGGRGLATTVTFTSTTGRLIRAVVGLLLVALGLIQTGRLSVTSRWFEPAVHRLLNRQARLRRRHPVAGFAMFGFGYLAAGFG